MKRRDFIKSVAAIASLPVSVEPVWRESNEGIIALLNKGKRGVDPVDLVCDHYTESEMTKALVDYYQDIFYGERTKPHSTGNPTCVS